MIRDRGPLVNRLSERLNAPANDDQHGWVSDGTEYRSAPAIDCASELTAYWARMIKIRRRIFACMIGAGDKGLGDLTRWREE